MIKHMNRQSLVAPLISLFTSASTLICCALPALLVTIGAGATLAGLVSNVPQLIWLSEHKIIVFSVAGVMLFFAVLLQWRNRRAPCPIDPDQARACMALRRWSLGITIFSVIIYVIGFFFAFFAAKLLAS